MAGSEQEPEAGDAANRQSNDDDEVPWTRGDHSGWWGRDWWGARRTSDATTNDSFGSGRWAMPERQESGGSTTDSGSSYDWSWEGQYNWWGAYDGWRGDRRDWGRRATPTIYETDYSGEAPRNDSARGDGAGGSTSYSYSTATRSGWAAWINAESLDVNKLGSEDGVTYTSRIGSANTILTSRSPWWAGVSATSFDDSSTDKDRLYERLRG